MASLDSASLSSDERRLLDRYAELLEAELGPALHAVWLFGSRARGEQPGEESDVDLLVLVDDASWDGKLRVRTLLDEAARELGLDVTTAWFSVHVGTPGWLERRREIRSFFIAEVERDKIVVKGSA